MDSIISNADDADQYRYISHVDFIRILRDKYKEGTKSTFEKVKAQVEQECEKKKQKAEKATELLSHCRQALSQLDEQHEMIEKTLKQHTKLGKRLNEQIRQQKDSLTNDERAMRQLLHELRTHNE